MSRKVLDAIIPVVENNYGHAGVKWLEFVTKKMRNPAFIAKLKKEHEKAKVLFLKDENPNIGADRAVAYFASVMITARLLSECFKWDIELLEKRVMEGFHLATTPTEDNAPKHQRSFKNLQGWVHKNINKFIKVSSTEKYEENNVKTPDRSEIWGIYKAGEFVAIDPHTLEAEFLEKQNFSRSVIAQWKEEGFLDCEPGRNVKRIRTEALSNGVLKGTPRFYCVPWEKFNPDDEE